MLRRFLRSRLTVAALLAGLTPVLTWSAAAEEEVSRTEKKNRQQAKLSVFNGLIGGWRGTGQVRRGSTKGAWREHAEWVWDFQPEDVGLRYDLTDGHVLKSGRLTYDLERSEYVLTAIAADDAQRIYRGAYDGDRLTLESKPDADGEVHRMTVTPLNEKRTLVLHEQRPAAQQSYQRIGEVGYTRAGTRLAVDSTGLPECVVTGGAGTIKVMHDGKEYFVCCTGCKQAFDDDPQGILAEYAARREKEKAKRDTVP